MIRKMMPNHSYEILKKKFRGCLLGSLLGDCLGAPFEGDIISSGEKIVIKNYIDKLETDFRGPIKQYTDDTAMTRSVAKALIDKPEPDYILMAKLFVKEYFREPKRGYGQNVITVFNKLKQNKFQDIYKPASEQFDGSGSLGNGGAMRIAPIALYFFDKHEMLVDAATKATRITHTNPLGINGALLQCMAIEQTFKTKHGEKIDVHKFIEELLQGMEKIEYEEDEDLNEIMEKPYSEKLLMIQNLLQRRYENDELYDEVIESLGNSISALESVPTAIYCFLKACSETTEIKDIFRKAVEYAITLGGDADTIASMTGAIAGAYVGEENINKNLVENCEKYKEMIEMADDLLSSRGDVAVEVKNS